MPNFLPLIGVSGRLQHFIMEFCNDVSNITVCYVLAIMDLLECTTIVQFPESHGQCQSRFQGWPPVGGNLHQSYCQMIPKEVEEVWIQYHCLVEPFPVIVL